MADEISDEELLTEYFRGESKAFDTFFSRHFVRVCRYAVKLGISSQESKEVAQEVFLKVHRFIHNYEQGRPAMPWLFSIAHNTCVDWKRKKLTTVEMQLTREEINPNLGADYVEPIFEEVFEVNGSTRIALESLSTENRNIVELRTVEEKTFREISQLTGKSEVSLRKIYERSIEKMRQLLRKEGVERERR